MEPGAVVDGEPGAGPRAAVGPVVGADIEDAPRDVGPTERRCAIGISCTTGVAPSGSGRAGSVDGPNEGTGPDGTAGPDEMSGFEGTGRGSGATGRVGATAGVGGGSGAGVSCTVGSGMDGTDAVIDGSAG